MLHLFRLFYLYQDTMSSYIKEESFFICLTWLYPLLSGTIVSVLLGENFLNSNQSTSLIWYSSCSKTPVLWEEFDGSIFNAVTGLTHLIVVFVTIGIQIATYRRQKHLENQGADGIMVVTYNRDGITISNRKPDQPSSHTLSRHYNRTVVTPRASLLSFLVIFPYYLLILLSGHMPNVDKGPSGPPVFGQFIIFLSPSIIFFLYPLVETIFSPTLRDTLTDFFLCRRRAYYVVDV